MGKEAQVLLAPLPRGYKWIEDKQSADNTTIVCINGKGTITYKRIVPVDIKHYEKGK